MYKKLLGLMLLSTGIVGADWGDPVTVSKNVAWFTGDMGTNSNGDAVAVYTLIDKKKAWAVATSKSATSKWFKSDKISKKASWKSSFLYSDILIPQVFVDNDGDAVAVWNFPLSKDTQQIQGATFHSGSWTLTSDLTGTLNYTPKVLAGMDGQGNTIVAWQEGTTIESAYLEKGSTRWKSLPTQSLGYDFASLSLKVTESGDAWLIWSKGKYGIDSDNVTVTSFSGETKTWSTPQILAPEGKDKYWYTSLAVDKQGNVFASWQQADCTFEVSRYDVNRKVWEKTDFVQPKDNHLYANLGITIDPSGNAVCVYPDDYGLISSELPQGSLTWSEPTWVTTDDVLTWTYKIDNEGNRLLTWINFTDQRLKISLLPLNQKRWSYPDHFDEASQLDSVALYSNGGALILYEQPTGTLISITGTDIFNEAKAKASQN